MSTEAPHPEPTVTHPDATDPGSAPNDDSLHAVIEQMTGGHEQGQFQTVEGATIVCLTCRNRFGAESQHADDVARLEGASDPADMAMLVPVRCPHCSTAGTLVLRYGPEASAEEAELLLALDRSPRDSGRA